MTIRVVTDSTCDLPVSTIEKYGIKVIPLYINVGEEEYLDGIDITREEFYTRLPGFPTHPTTAVPSPLKFKAIYDALAEEGATDIISIHISESLSAMVNVARAAAQETISAAIHVIDGHQLSLGTGFLVEKAAELATKGQHLKEILDALNSQMKRTHVFAALDTLEFLKRSGRMNRWVSNIGSLLQIKPILTMHDGLPGNEKVRTRDKALKRVVEMLEAVGRIERVALVHTNAPERIAELRKMAAHLLPSGDILTEDITPVIGAHIGPGASGFAVVAAE
ncbi:MAG TPA: DegV family protein [Anaerolineaceae bacterium]|nr:DegV family protein [Anaerolineaceae bacterium]